MPGQQLLLGQWANFCSTTATASATLLGLLFVVITLGAERRRNDHDHLKIRIYLTPAVIYLSSVLLMSAVLTIPNQTRLTAAICICLGGIAGLGYSASLAVRRDGGAFYRSRAELIPYVILPFAAFALMATGSIFMLQRPPIGLDLVAAGMLVLLAIAIRNSWAIAASIVSSRE